MFGKRITLFRLLGFAVRVDLSWIFIAVLVTWSLASVFGEQFPDLGQGTLWLMALGGMVGLFFSIVFHELSHSIVARHGGMEMNGITLFIFGGVAEMGDEPPSAGTEFWMAVVGPFSSLLLGLAFRLGAIAAQDASVPVAAVLRQLSFMNVLLAIFNLLPGFPLDGGRILRAALWGWRKSLRWATRVASRVGSIFGILLMILGVGVTLWFRDFMGIWWLLIGMFLHNAAQMSYRQVIVRQALEGEPVLRFMQQDPVTVAPETTIDRLVDDYVYRHMYKMYPVVEPGGELRGCINTRQVKELPREEWPVRHVSELMEPCSNNNSVSPYTDALRALTLMNRGRKSRLLVVDGGRLVGVLALKDLLRFLSLKIDLEESGKDTVQQGGTA